MRIIYIYLTKAILFSVLSISGLGLGLVACGDGSESSAITPTDMPAATGKLVDTGQTAEQCYTALGRDDIGPCKTADEALGVQDGHIVVPFDYTKISNRGARLSASAALGSGASDWACTLDNITGLLWEVKTEGPGLRSKENRYSNLGNDKADKDAAKFVVAVNAEGLCGYKDWRLPTVNELQSIVDYGRMTPAIDPVYFVNTIAQPTWTSMARADNPDKEAWYVKFNDGGVDRGPRSNDKYAVRLVRASRP